MANYLVQNYIHIDQNEKLVMHGVMFTAGRSSASSQCPLESALLYSAFNLESGTLSKWTKARSGHYSCICNCWLTIYCDEKSKDPHIQTTSKGVSILWYIYCDNYTACSLLVYVIMCLIHASHGWKNVAWDNSRVKYPIKCSTAKYS